MSNRGVEIGIHLSPGLKDEGFVAQALGNLAAFRLAAERGEKLQWQVFRITGGVDHHFRLVVRHPDRMLDLKLRKKLEDYMGELSGCSEDELRSKFQDAAKSGLKAQPLKTATEDLDLWSDNFWNWFG